MVCAVRNPEIKGSPSSSFSVAPSHRESSAEMAVLGNEDEVDALKTAELCSADAIHVHECGVDTVEAMGCGTSQNAPTDALCCGEDGQPDSISSFA